MTILSKNIRYNLIGQLSTLLLGFIAVKYIIVQLGEDALGIIYFTTLMSSLLKVALDLGVSATANREISANYEKEPSYIRDLIRTGSLLYWGAYFFFAMVVYFAAPPIVKQWINLTTMDVDTAILVLRILGVTSLLVFPQLLYVNLFKGLQRMEYNNLIDLSFAAFRQLGTVVTLALGGSLFHVVYLHGLCYILTLLTYLVFLRRFFPIKALYLIARLIASQFASDGLHFNTAGYEVFARLVWRHLLAKPFGACPP